METIQLEKKTLRAVMALVTKEQLTGLKDTISAEDLRTLTLHMPDAKAAAGTSKNIHRCYTNLYTRILDILNSKNMKDSELYNGIGMSRQKWNNLKNGLTERFREKNEVLRIIVYLKLTEDEGYHLLHLNGNAIPPQYDATDVVVFRTIHDELVNYLDSPVSVWVQRVNQRLLESNLDILIDKL